MPNDPTYLGTVKDVKGFTVSVSLDNDASVGLAFINGQGYRIGQIGSFVRIPMGYIDLFGIVSQVGASAVPYRSAEVNIDDYKWMTVQLIGEGYRRGQFTRGVSQYPTIGDQVHLVTEQDLVRIYGQPDEPYYVKVGHLASAESIPALIDVNKLLTRHSAVVGTTGAGKSTTVAGLLASLSDSSKYPSARIIIFDIHGEYAAALNDRATIFRINPDISRNEKPLFIPYWAMTFDELLSITFGSLDDVSRGAILEKITALKLYALNKYPRAGVSENNLTVDTPVPFSIHKLWFDLHRLVNATHTTSGNGQSEQTEALLLDQNSKPVQPGDAMKVIPPKYRPYTQATGVDKIYQSSSPLNIRRPLESLASKLRDPRFDFLFRPGEWCPNIDGKPEKDLDSLLDQWMCSKHPITILDLSGIPNNILTNLIGTLLRIIYDALFWSRYLSEGGRERPLLLVLEEAHLYLHQGDTGPSSLAVSRIVKEGRKYGIGAMIVSQRPAEIDTTILSQCGTIFAMRLTNSTDRAHVTGTVTDNLEGLLNMLPVLRTGEAIILGEAVHLPVRTIIDPPPTNRRPDSSDPWVYNAPGPGGWNRARETDNYADVIEVWRKQEPRSHHLLKVTDKEEIKNMDRLQVESSNVASVGYDEKTLTLEVEFRNGSIYQYFDVPKSIYNDLISAESVGKYLNTQIKLNYRFAKL